MIERRAVAPPGSDATSSSWRWQQQQQHCLRRIAYV